MTPTEESPDATLRRGSFRWGWLVVALAAFGVFANTLGYGAAWDDNRFVFNSGATDGVSAIPEMFTTQMVRDLPRARGAYRPLTASSYAIDWTLGGGNASFFHWTNVVLHMGVSVLVWLLLVRLGAPPLPALAGGLVYAVHPVHVEAVANIAGRSELLVGLFMIGAAVLYLGERSLARTVGILACLVGGMLSKEHGVMLPVLLVLVEVFRPGSAGSVFRRLVSRWRLWLAMGLAGAGYMAARRAVLGTFSTVDVAPFILDLSTLGRVTSAIANWVHYARLHLFPRDLSVDYGPAVVMPSGFGDLTFWAGLSVGVIALAVAIWSFRRQRLIALGIAWFAVAMLPSSNLIVPIAQWLAERFFYVPSVGFSMMVAGGLAFLPTPRASREARLAWGGALVLVVLLASRSWTRNQRWEDNETIIATLITEHPEAFRAQWYLGRVYFEQGRIEEAFVALDSATALQPNAIELRLERAEWLLRMERYPEAEALLRALPYARHVDREAFLVRALLGQDRTEAADSALSEGLRAFPQSPGIVRLADSLGVRPDG